MIRRTKARFALAGIAVAILAGGEIVEAQTPARIPAGIPQPAGSTPMVISATGTTAATTATLPASTIGQNTYLCGFSIRASATAAATGDATVTGVAGGTMHFTQWTSAAATGIGLVEERLTPCMPTAAANTGIAVISAAPGSGGVVSVSAWGYQY